MSRFVVLGIIVVALATAAIGQGSQTAENRHAISGLIRVERLNGDLPTGFRDSCLLVYEDGYYHREVRQQEAHSLFGDWNPVVVYEGTLPPGYLDSIKRLVELPSFRNITGTLGDPDILLFRVAFTRGSVVPEYNVDILNVIVAHPGGRQVFEVLMDNVRIRNPLNSFLKWVKNTEKHGKGRVPHPVADNCMPHSEPASKIAWTPVTDLKPHPLYTPPPDNPGNQQNSTQSGKVVIDIDSIINVDGTVTALRVKHGLNPELDQRALDALRKWKFEPARIDGMPIAAHQDVKVEFQPH